uniref:trafficking regulator of GLUT4 1-like n=1 Tax=Euleptes europaea TaxID=460621 RepID=UPI0025412495|nr:trafficking regulator of GLUT4 1-like [Euleptes europaea]
MDSGNNQGGPPSAHNLPPYSEKHPYHQQPLPADWPANPGMPTQYQAYYPPYGAVPGQGAVIQPPQQTTFMARVQPTHEPDYLVYSILTMIFCCLPLGIAALVFSIQTRDANHDGDGIAAKRNSRKALIFASCALGLGLLWIIVVIVLVVIANNMVD